MDLMMIFMYSTVCDGVVEGVRAKGVARGERRKGTQHCSVSSHRSRL